MNLSGKKVLVDPVFYQGSPVSFVNKMFKGTDVYKPTDMPDIDYLVITHDHWDHLDYQVVKELEPRVKKVVTELGVGEHFEYWGYPAQKLVELDWWESADLEIAADGAKEQNAMVFVCIQVAQANHLDWRRYRLRAAFREGRRKIPGHRFSNSRKRAVQQGLGLRPHIAGVLGQGDDRA